MAIYDRDTSKLVGRLNKRPHFDSLPKNLRIIADRFHNDDDLVKLLVRPVTDVMEEGKPDVTISERTEVLTKNLVTKPVLPKNTEIMNYIFMQFVDIVPFKDKDSGVSSSMKYALVFDIVCNVDNWTLDDYNMRPYAIMERVDDLIGDTKIDSFGHVQFMGATALKVNEEMSGYTMMYQFGEV